MLIFGTLAIYVSSPEKCWLICFSHCSIVNIQTRNQYGLGWEKWLLAILASPQEKQNHLYIISHLGLK